MGRDRRDRLVRATIGIAAMFAVLLVRLAWLQTVGLDEDRELPAVAERAVQMRSSRLELDSGRGQFAARDGSVLTGETVWALAAFPEPGLPRGDKRAVDRLAALLRTDPQRLTEWLSGLRSADVWRSGNGDEAFGLTKEQAEEVRGLGLTGIAALPYRNRYPLGLGVSPIHAIGFVSQNPDRLKRLYGRSLTERERKLTDRIGGAGLELSLDRLLIGVGRTEAIQISDAARRPLRGLGLRLSAPDNPHYPLKVTTTLDLAIQQEAERVMAARGIRTGAIVVLDASNADILAMVSVPGFHPDRIGEEGTDESNRALIAEPPGSVFKTVTLAAALEAGVTDADEHFRCDGDYGRYGLHCWRKQGHGVLSLEQAYAESCNVAFAALAERLHPEALRKTADKLGIGRRVGWHADTFADGLPLRPLGEEEAGTVFHDAKSGYDGGVRTGTGIGQRDVRLSPLQAANLVVTLLHGGKVTAPRLVSEIRYADGGLLAKLPVQASPSAYGSIRPQTAAYLRRAMKAVAEEGTAARALAEAKWPLAGKSGTAEIVEGPGGCNHHWFVGYGPAEGTARYAVAVLIENQPIGVRNRAADVFGDLMEKLRKLEQKKDASASRTSRKQGTNA